MHPGLVTELLLYHESLIHYSSNIYKVISANNTNIDTYSKMSLLPTTSACKTHNIKFEDEQINKFQPLKYLKV